MVSRALKLIEGGALDEGDVASLADRLEIGERQLRRLFRRHLGAAPITVAHVEDRQGSVCIIVHSQFI